ncbi:MULTISPECIES: transglycosylase family protein [unclassified Rhodococcus (in: high G+C Gram-positive bacteria)]|uniref:transglycosylase family protein n=1 Tax=unclassified Rhodococcus (in: high G+C Gram-positive bacteria) TaxID=192944 RepID=UPI00163A5D43|nr:MULTISPECIES: transglycosylase family protein [unclassified Rhodococcus (in: high G+C Gram-positive bacteria)]MBC2638052.1 transglycosylase family protein [Rhodococcus sp. 3A]MBC2897201.1 transglycosylase family protein [Rhodococcus sp. 4CII]
MITRTVRQRTLGWIALIGAVAAALLGLAAGSASAAPHDWDAVAECESGGDWTTDTGNGFYGGLQFTPETWKANGGKGDPSEASEAEQIRVAENVLKTQGPGAWPVCGQYLKKGGTPPVVEAPKPTPAPAPAIEKPAPPIEKPAPAIETPEVETPKVQTPGRESPAPVEAPDPETSVPVQAPAPAEAPAEAPATAEDAATVKAAAQAALDGARALAEQNGSSQVFEQRVAAGR